MITAQEIRQKYLDCFRTKEHKIIPSASLLPENDPTTLFTTAGMHPLVPYLMGENHPEGKRIVDIQKCIRTTDIDEVGDTTHHTFFEMMGNWSFGDYFKNEAIEWSWEFLTSEKWLSLDKNRIAVSVFQGDEDADFDNVAFEKWKSLGMPVKKIAKLPKKNNWWGPAGETGPCGPDTEIFYWVGDENSIPASFNDDNDLWVEIWNNVFMEFEKTKRVILLDGMHFLYDENFKVNEKLLNIIQSFNAKKILVVNGFSDKARELLKETGIDVFSLEKEQIKKENDIFFKILFDKYNLKPEEVIYLDHLDDNLKGAEKAGVKYKKISNGKDLEEITLFIKNNIHYFVPLKQQNVDTGMGLERILAILNGFDDNYKTELFAPIIAKIEEFSGKKYGDISIGLDESMRIVADHIKASVLIIGDDKGIVPSNKDQGYVVRRLIRRAIRQGHLLEIKKENWTKDLAEIVIEMYGEIYTELVKNREFILSEIDKEEVKFKKTLENGLKEFDKYIAGPVYLKGNLSDILMDMSKIDEELSKKPKMMAGSIAFNLFTTFGFPIEIIEEIAKEKGIIVDIQGFKEKMKEHQELSQTASAGKFKGGLADSGAETTRLHTVAHLMLASLRKVLGEHIHQKGSNITAERLRFDFSHPDKLTDEQKTEVERLVNEAIEKKLPVIYTEMTLDEAKKIGAEGVFESKYGEKVKVYQIGEGENLVSLEICGGPHIKNTEEIKSKFKIKKEESSGAGVRRVKAVVE